jgi:hypothetical protein
MMQCYTVTTTHHQERKQLYLQHLVFVSPLVPPATIAVGGTNGHYKTTILIIKLRYKIQIIKSSGFLKNFTAAT